MPPRPSSAALAVLTALIALFLPTAAQAALCTNYYTDADGDGYGGSSYVFTCYPTSSQTTTTGDCNDADKTAYPGAPEVCDGVDDDCDGSIDEGVTKTWYVDADADGYGGTRTKSACSLPTGYTATPGDCDDLDKTVNPGRTETCNGKDDDCDKVVDESDASGAPTWYADADGDGYGAATASTVACSQPSGYVAVAGDCNDGNPAVSPAATEACNKVDDDCDGTTDEADAADAATWFLDDDGDGYGDAAATTTACTAPSGYVADDTDCDDAAAAVSPGATERCNAIDDDCDGVTDEPDAADAPTWYADADGDGHGDAGATAQACSEPTGHVAEATDCDDTDPAVSPDGTERCNTIDDDCDGTIDEDDAADTTAWFLDADGDGYGDASFVAFACEPPSDHVASGTDCDDTDPTVSPGAAEHCNAVDDDCDGSVDETGAVDAPTWYADADRDGYGDPSVTQQACVAPSGYVADDSDCDDADASVAPAPTWYADDDHDGFGDPDSSRLSCTGSSGYIADATDCNDSDDQVNPAAAESCNGVDDDCDGTIDESDAADALTWYADADGDGHGDPVTTTVACDAPEDFVAAGDDCDDADPTVRPGAAETCNGVDDDCDGTVDEGVKSTWYRDADADGFGASAVTTLACAAPTGYVADATDCADGDAGIHPGAAERCNGTDDDCDGTVDEGVKPTWYRDADADGFGRATSTLTSCAAPSGYVADATDCDDTRTSVHPGATEVCNTRDDDCDGATDEGVTSTFYVDADADGFGGSATTQACAAPSGYAAADGDCDDGSDAIWPGANELCDGSDNDCDGAVDETAPVWYADADGDGYGTSASTATGCTAPTGYVGSSTDCDDAASAVHPGAAESCNGADDDCDGLVDDGTGDPYFADADGDGFGDAAVTTLACSGPPSGTVADATDCDDERDTVFPGATERCNELDDDCDGVVDEAAADAITWYADSDDDGYGESGSGRVACEDPDGMSVTVDGDCDDVDAAIHPGALEGPDGVDQDCDGTVDEGTSLYDDDGDGYTEAGGDCDDTDDSVRPSAAEICDGRDEDCDGVTDDGTECFDDDGDGWMEIAGDCDDADPAISPGASQIPSNTVDEDCDGLLTLPTDDEEGTDAYDDDGDGFSEDEGDCDDGDAARSPDAEETADGVDEDCDGLVDEGTEAYDDDGDGWTEEGGDCDDHDPSVNPAAEESDGNGLDDDCDGETDPPDDTGDADDLDGDGFTAGLGDCDDGDELVYPAAYELCDGLDNDCNGTIDDGCAEEDAKGCGCSLVASTTAAWLPVLLALALTRRRRSA